MIGAMAAPAKPHISKQGDWWLCSVPYISDELPWQPSFGPLSLGRGRTPEQAYYAWVGGLGMQQWQRHLYTREAGR